MVRVNEDRLRLLVACGAAAGISATFNAPLTGVFFGLELILGSVSAEAIAVVLVASMTADALSRAVFGSAPFFGGLATGGGHSLLDYLLFAVLGLLAGFVGVLFKTVLYASRTSATGSGAGGRSGCVRQLAASCSGSFFSRSPSSTAWDTR